MDARQITSLITQRAAGTAFAVALTLGLTASVLAPAQVNAAPINPAKGPSYSADLTVIDWRVAGFSAGERAVIPLEVRNQGSSTASPVRVKVVSSLGFSGLQVSGSGWSCRDDGLIGIGQHSYTCETASIAGGASKSLTVEANTIADEFKTMTFTVDPQNAVRESNERNNQVTSNY